MATVTRCLREIQSVRQVVRGAEAAYVARSRVARLSLSVARLASAMAGIRSPDRPGRLAVPDHESDEVKRVLWLANAIQDVSEFIRQPSEPLDGRWVRMWQELKQHLDSLEGALLSLNGDGGGRKPSFTSRQDQC